MPRHRSTPTRSHSPLLGFLRIHRSVLAVTATFFVFASISVHDLPAEAVTPQDATSVEGQRLTVPASQTASTTTTPTVTRDMFNVTTYSMVEWPISPSSKVGDRFGQRTAPCSGCSTSHRGTDFNPGFGTPVGAIADGVVTEIGDPSGALGVYAIIQHTVDGVTISSVYGHMELGSLQLSVGQTVSRGQLVGLVGDTGQSTGPHLHFGILDASGSPIDSLVWIAKHANTAYVAAG